MMNMLLKTMIYSFFGIIFIDSLLFSMSTAPNKKDWSYEGKTGPEHWGRLSEGFYLCEERNGKLQSPFDIRSTYKIALPDINFNYKNSSVEVVNNGHTIQVNIDKGSAISIPEGNFELLQFHFHAPSEYYINGKKYPLALHFVHKNNDGKLAVVGVIFEEGGSNPLLASFFKSSLKEKGTTLPLNNVNLNSLLPRNKKYYRFMGSLTTPPCSEGVLWHVLQVPVTASRSQIQAFQEFFENNARPLQPVNNRLILEGV